jgi:hypothetical protein
MQQPTALPTDFRLTKNRIKLWHAPGYKNGNNPNLGGKIWEQKATFTVASRVPDMIAQAGVTINEAGRGSIVYHFIGILTLRHGSDLIAGARFDLATHCL